MYFSVGNAGQIEIQRKNHTLLLDDSTTSGTHLCETEKQAHRHFYIWLQLAESFASSKKQSIAVSKIP